MKYIKNYESSGVAVADQTIVSPNVSYISSTGGGKLLMLDTGTDGEELQITGTSISDLAISKKPSGPTYEYVDLGLSVKWCTMNVGASSITDYGDYFAWGESSTYYTGTAENPSFAGGGYAGTPDGDYQWVNSSYQEVGTQPYNSSTLILNAANDVCKVKMGGSWRMPTSEEIQELVNLGSTWVTNYQGSGINGRTFTGNGNTLFIPASGLFSGTSRSNAGSYCYLWSSSRDGDGANHAYRLGFSSYYCYVYGSERCYGYAVRGVC